MIRETGRIVALGTSSVWVETIQRSTCNSCAAQSGCGQSLLAKWAGHTAYLRVLTDGCCVEDLNIHDAVEIGIPEEVVVKGSLFVYLTPLLLLMLGSWVGHSLLGSEAMAIFGAVIGLLCGGLVVRWRFLQTRDDRNLQPVLLSNNHSAIRFVKPTLIS